MVEITQLEDGWFRFKVGRATQTFVPPTQLKFSGQSAGEADVSARFTTERGGMVLFLSGTLQASCESKSESLLNGARLEIRPASSNAVMIDLKANSLIPQLAVGKKIAGYPMLLSSTPSLPFQFKFEGLERNTLSMMLSDPNILEFEATFTFDVFVNEKQTTQLQVSKTLSIADGFVLPP